LSRLVSRTLAATLASTALGVTAAAAALAPASAALAATSQPGQHDQANVNQWRLAFAERTTPGSLGEVAPTGPNDAWSIGDVSPKDGTDDPYVAHWNGKQWQTVHIAALNGYELMGVAASSKANAWIFADDPPSQVQKAFVYNGTHWQPITLPAGAYLGDAEGQGRNAVVFGPKNVWVTTKSGVTHWNGSTWTATTIKKGIDEIAGTSDGNLWVAGGTFAYHLVKGRWTSVGFTAARGTTWEALSTTSPSDVWIGGYSGSSDNSTFMLHKTSHGWQKIVAPWWAAGAPLTLTSDGHGGAWPNYTGHWTGKAWVLAATWNAPVNGVTWVNMVKIPGTSGSYWAAIGAGIDGTRNIYPGIFVYGPLP
jgi:hypothetical protein